MSFVWQLNNLGAGWNPKLKSEDLLCSLSIQVGERVALLGDAHSGIRTLFRVLAGVVPHKSGELTVFGKTIDRRNSWEDWDNIFENDVRRKIGVAFETDGLLASLSVRTGLEMIFRTRYGDHSEKLLHGASLIVQQIAARLGLSEALDCRPFDLTQAERRLVSLARALLSKPLAFLLENPTQGIGDLHKKIFLKQLAGLLADSSRTLCMATEDWKLAAALCPRWVFVQGGRIVFDGKKEAFLNEFKDYAKLIGESFEDILNSREAA